MGDDAAKLDAALAAISNRLQLDPAILLGALAADPPPLTLWAEVERACNDGHLNGSRDWTELSAAARAVAECDGSEPLTCWVVDAEPAEAFALASALLFAAPDRDLVVLATHADPLMAEIARTALLSDAAMRLAPPDSRSAHFRRLDGCWRAAPALRAVVRFDTVAPTEDAVVSGSAEGFDLVVCRGRLSRLGHGAVERKLTRLLRQLRHGGYLLVGPGEHDTPALADLDRRVVPGALLYQRRRTSHGTPPDDFAKLVAALEADPTAWEPRWRLACELLREGYAEVAVSHLREAVRRHPGEARVWEALAQAYTLLDDQPAVNNARRQANLAALVPNAA